MLKGFGLPIYDEEKLKNFQLKGNWLNYRIDIINCTNDRYLPFITPWIDVDVSLGVYSLIVYSISESGLQTCKTYDDLVALRSSYDTLSNALIVKEIKGTKQRWYFDGKTLADSQIVSGIYEIIITLNDGTVYESELFSTCLSNSEDQAEFVCSNAVCADVEEGHAPVFSIDIDEVGGFPGSGYVTVRWHYTADIPFNQIIFNSWLFGGANPVVFEEVVPFTLTGYGSITLTSTFLDDLVCGQYTVEYEASFPGCSGTIQYDVNQSCFTITAHSWA